MHVYGLRLDREKFDIKEMLDIFEPDLNKVERRFEIYNALMQHRRKHWLKTLVQRPLIDIIQSGINWTRNLVRRSRGTVWCHRASRRASTGRTRPGSIISVIRANALTRFRKVLALVREAGFTVHRMLGQGQEYPPAHSGRMAATLFAVV